jgi:CheY-like chemotaxis protein
MSPGIQKKILVASGNERERDDIMRNLGRSGYLVIQVENGAVAMNRALADLPDMIIADVELPLVDGFKVCQLLRTNPATRHVPFVFITDKETNPKKLGEFVRPADDFILKPFKAEELIGRVNNVFYRLDKVQEVSAEADRSVAGTLTEIALVDLLQIFKMNKKSGILTLKGDGVGGTIFIKDGVVVNARTGRVNGLKAMYRLISWLTGTFEFKPSLAPTEIRIHQQTESLIMEGLRQFDELNRIREKLPSRKTALRLRKSFTGPVSKLRPVTREVLHLLEYFSRVEDIVDNANFPDLEVYLTLLSFIEHDVVEVRGEGETEAGGPSGPLLSLEEALKIGYYLGVGRGEPNKRWLGKALLFSQRPDFLERFLDKAEDLQEIRREDRESGEAGSETYIARVRASITIMDKITLLLYNLSPARGCEPLWQAFHHRAIGALILGDGTEEGDRVVSPVAAFLGSRKIPYSSVMLSPEGAPPAGPREPGSVPWVPLDPNDPEFSRKALRSFFETILAE